MTVVETEMLSITKH